MSHHHPQSPPSARALPTFPVPAARPPMRLGLTVHRLDAAHLTTLRALGVTQVRTTLYPTALGEVSEEAVEAASAAQNVGLELLVVVNGPPSGWAPLVERLAPRWPTAAWQLGNECEGSVGADAYVDAWRDAWSRVPVGTRLVTAAVGGAPTTLYLDALLAAACIPHAVAVHAYGPPPATQLRERCDAVAGRLARWAVPVPVWCTEFGLDPAESLRLQQSTAATYPHVTCAAWQAVAEQAPALNVARAYGYCLDAADPLGIDGQPTAAWLAATQGPT